MKKRSLNVKWLIMMTGIFLLVGGYSDDSTVWGPSGATAAENASQPTFAACNDWIQTNHRLEYSKHGCKKYTDMLKVIVRTGGRLIPVDTNRFFIVWFPDDWDTLPNKKIIITLHGDGGCAEKLFQWWAKISTKRKYAIVALQYAEEDSTGELHFSDSSQVYEYLRVILDKLRTQCPIGDAPIVLHGFSRGSARTFELAVMDRADDGMKAFSAFISDSGTVFPENNGRLSPYLQAAAANAYSGAHFWLYCGGRDHGGQTCKDIEKMRHFVLAHGGTVDEFHKNSRGGHGIFITGNPRKPGTSLTALFDYIDNL